MGSLKAEAIAPIEALDPVTKGVYVDNLQPQVFRTNSLYVGELDATISEQQLYELFRRVGPVMNTRICRDIMTHQSLGYGYVNYFNLEDAQKALENLNFSPYFGTPLRIMYSCRNPSLRKSGAGNTFIKNLDRKIDHKALQETFASFGNVLSCKVAMDTSGNSKGYGFVQFETEESSQQAIKKLNGMLINDKQVYVGPFLCKKERGTSAKNTKFSNVFVKNLSLQTTEQELESVFGEVGKTTSVVVMKDESGQSKCFGFVNFENPENAAKAVEFLNGRTFDDKKWFVGKAQKKAEREAETKKRLERAIKVTIEKYKAANLYVKNIADGITDDAMKQLFSPYGEIRSCKVMREGNGTSKGCGFVCFYKAESAWWARAEMNGKMVKGKPLYVAIAQKKEERKKILQARFAAMYGLSAGGWPSFGQAMFYGQAPYVAPPAMRQNWYGLGRRDWYGFGNGFGSQQEIIRELGYALATTPAEKHRDLVGERLYAMVDQMAPEFAGKVTGMLLEMEMTDILSLMEAPFKLRAKVSEAVDLLTKSNA